MARRAITDQDRTSARQLLLTWLADDNGDIDQITLSAFDLHVEYNTFPGEEFMRIAADALEVSGIDRADPIDYKNLLVDHLPEIEFKGKQYPKIRFAVMCSAGLRGGLDPDLLDEVAYWNDDYWRYALFGAIALVRASAAKTGVPVADLARRVVALNHLSSGPTKSDDAERG